MSRKNRLWTTAPKLRVIPDEEVKAIRQALDDGNKPLSTTQKAALIRQIDAIYPKPDKPDRTRGSAKDVPFFWRVILSIGVLALFFFALAALSSGGR
jgi:hypothetical protein